MIDVSAVVAEVAAQAAPVVLIGGAVLLVYAGIKAFKWVRASLGYSGTSSAAPASRWAAEAAQARKGGMEGVYARAAAMAAAGEGQSDVYGHNLQTEAYDAGYMGRRLGDVVDPAAMEAFALGKAAGEEDFDADFAAYEAERSGVH